ncbi:MAG: YkgJ family cysteine cluster protein [Eubacteriales bacterium]|nr:YkgJ family cysteine cluster protein [Eubacteriales bacterium]
MFLCDKCGGCCRNLDKSPIYAELDQGNGICRYLTGNLCSIYENRPLICRVDDCYDLYFKDSMSQEEYYACNHAVCERIKKHQL